MAEQDNSLMSYTWSRVTITTHNCECEGGHQWVTPQRDSSWTTPYLWPWRLYTERVNNSVDNLQGVIILPKVKYFGFPTNVWNGRSLSIERWNIFQTASLEVQMPSSEALKLDWEPTQTSTYLFHTSALFVQADRGTVQLRVHIGLHQHTHMIVHSSLQTCQLHNLKTNQDTQVLFQPMSLSIT